MTRPLLCAALFGVTALLASGPVLAQAKVDPGQREFESNCAGCHGLAGQGDGTFQPYLNLPIPDLTALAKKNNGVFPVERIYQMIDGRLEVKGHGSRTMPVWGKDYLVQMGSSWPGGHMDVPYDPEVFVRSRIMALVDYINRLQMK